jgi:hypothetical protein
MHRGCSWADRSADYGLAPPSYGSSPFPHLYRDWNGDDGFVGGYLVQPLIPDALGAEALRKKRKKRRKCPGGHIARALLAIPHSGDVLVEERGR